MSTPRASVLLLAALALAACDERQGSDLVAGPSLAPPVNPQACAPTTLNSLISGYFPGNSGAAAKTAKDQMLAAAVGSDDRLNAGFVVLQEIGTLSRNQVVDGVAGSNLAQGIIKCMYDVSTFLPSFPSNAIYNFAPALAADAGGAFYTRGDGTGTENPVHGAAGAVTGTPDILSGVTPFTGTWAAGLAGSPAKKALIYGYKVTNDPFVYEWATIPPATNFANGALVALCDGNDPSTAMVSESNIGVLAYQSASPICDASYSVAIKETGWGPRALAARLAHVVVDAMQPQPLQALALKSGTGGTATTFKSKFKKNPVTTVTLTFTQTPKAKPKVGETVTAEVRATTLIDGVATGVNGVCVYLKGANNNGTGTSLSGVTDSRCQTIPEWVGDYTESKNLQAGYAAYSFSVTKTGGLSLIATASDDNDNPIGVVGRNGQTFVGATFKMNVNP